MKSKPSTSKADLELARWCEVLSAGATVAEEVPPGWKTIKTLAAAARARSNGVAHYKYFRRLEDAAAYVRQLREQIHGDFARHQ